MDIVQRHFILNILVWVLLTESKEVISTSKCKALFPETQRDKDNDVLINWNIATYCNLKFNTQNTDVLPCPQTSFIERILASSMFNKGDISSSMAYLYINLQWRINCKAKHVEDKINPLSLCKVFDYLSWRPTTKTWRIHVYLSFMINITIIKAYIPFTEQCQPNNIAVS